MTHAVIAAAALLAAVLTFFSGFGLGTLLMPVFALFFPVEVAVASTAVVHLANNLFKLALVGRSTHTPTLLRFAVPAVIAAFLGAALLDRLAHLPPLHVYTLAGAEHRITLINAVIAAVIAAFAALELSPRFERWSVPPKWMPLGGAFSGFFGGLSGHQGALRSAFLLRAGLTKDQFIATGVASAVMVDGARLIVYGLGLGRWTTIRDEVGLGVVATACAAAFAGSLIGARLLVKTTLTAIRRTVAGLLVLLAAALGAGLV
jgi:hypothetical protein